MGKSKPKSNTSQTINPPAFAIPGLTKAAGAATDLFDQGPQQFFPGQTFAGFDPLQTQGQQSQLDFASQVLPGLNNQIFGSFGQSLNADVTQDPAVNAALDSIQSRGVQNFQENILPSLRRGATASGGEFGTRGDLAAGVAGRDFAGALADAQGSFLGNQLNSARQARGASLALAPQIAQQGLFGGQIQQGIGAQRQGLEQQGINEAMNRFNFEQQAPGQSINQLVAQLTGAAGGFGTQSGSASQSGGLNPKIGGAIGGGLLGNALSAGTFLGAGPGLALGPAGLAAGVLGALLS